MKVYISNIIYIIQILYIEREIIERDCFVVTWSSTTLKKALKTSFLRLLDVMPLIAYIKGTLTMFHLKSSISLTTCASYFCAKTVHFSNLYHWGTSFRHFLAWPLMSSLFYSLHIAFLRTSIMISFAVTKYLTEIP